MTSEHTDPRAKLRAVVAEFPGQRFAVIDGGHFANLPAQFKAERLFARSLFLEQVDAEVQKAGPWLVALDQSSEAADQVFAIVGEKPAVVFWCCSAGEAVLYRHLRSLNMARFPAWAATDDDGPSRTDADAGYATVFLRHFDPRVLGALLPILDASQFSRVLGPAEEIAYLASDYGGVCRVLADATHPPAPAGMLTVRNEQTKELNERRLAASHRRIAAYLKQLEPGVAARVTDEEMITHVAMSDRIGRDLGLKSEAAHGDWAYLMLMSHGRVARSPDARAFISRGDRPPDTQVERLRESTAEALKGWSIRFYPARGGGHGGSV